MAQAKAQVIKHVLPPLGLTPSPAFPRVLTASTVPATVTVLFTVFNATDDLGDGDHPAHLPLVAPHACYLQHYLLQTY